MHFPTTLISMLALAAHSLALAVPPLAKMRLTDETMPSQLETRAPHFFEIREPPAGYTLESPSFAAANATGSFEFKALDGEQSSEYSCKVYLQSSSGAKQQVADIPFDGYVATKTIQIDFNTFPDGSYTLVAGEISNKNGEVTTTLSQPFNIKKKVDS